MPGYVSVRLQDAEGHDLPGGEIYVDGVEQGRTPDTVEVSAGDHVFEVFYRRAPAGPVLTVPEGDSAHPLIITFRAT